VKTDPNPPFGKVSHSPVQVKQAGHLVGICSEARDHMIAVVAQGPDNEFAVAQSLPCLAISHVLDVAIKAVELIRSKV
jgi:hypothetical protein